MLSTFWNFTSSIPENKALGVPIARNNATWIHEGGVLRVILVFLLLAICL
jgi:hypothetical protein